MAYDQENIQGARKAGVLDSEMDALALGLNDGEKASLGKKLQAASQESRRDAPAPKKEKAATARPVQRTRSLTIWERIVNFFKSIFSGFNSETLASRKAVKESENILTAYAFPVYEPREKLVKKELIEHLKLIDERIQGFKDFFNTNFNISNEDLYFDRKPSFARFVIENMLTMEQLTKLREMREVDLARSFAVRGEEGTQKDLEVQVKQFENSINKETTSRIEAHLELFTAIINIKNYNFHALYTLFLKEGGETGVVEFRDFPLEHAVAHLRNFDSYLSGVPFRTVQEEHYQWFERFAAFQQERQDEESSFSADEFKEILQPLRKLFEKQILSHVVRVGTEDPTYRAKPVVNTISYVKKFKTMITKSIRDHVQRSITILREQEVSLQINELFEGGREYQPLPVSTREVNERLQTAGIQGFNHAFVFSLVYKYLELIYYDRFRKSVNAIVVEGEFRKKEMAQEFSNTYYGLDELFEQAKSLWADADEDSSLMVGAMRLIEGNLDNPIAIRKLENDISVTDEALKDIGRAMGLGLMRLYRIMDSILRDFRGIRVVDLVNAKTIGGVANRSLLFTYDKLVQSLKKLEGILSRFMVTAESVE